MHGCRRYATAAQATGLCLSLSLTAVFAPAAEARDAAVGDAPLTLAMNTPQWRLAPWIMLGAGEGAWEVAEEASQRRHGEADEPPFLKGNLAQIGTMQLLSRFDHIGVGLGAQIINSDAYVLVDPRVAFYRDKWSFALHVPLNLLAFNGDTLDYGGLKVRRQDWDEAPDFLRVIHFITYGRKEEPFYLSINTLRPTNISHGSLINRYQASADPDRTMTGLHLDAYNRFGGFEFTMNDLTLTNQVFGGIVFAKPLFMMDGVLESLSVGLEYAADFRAPRCVRKFDDDNAPCVRGSGHMAGQDPFTGANLDGTFVRTDDTTGRYAVETTTVQALGVSTELRLMETDRGSNIKAYGTYHQFLNDNGGAGFGAGLLGRFNAGTRWINAFRLRAEYQTYGDGYLPSYFDTFYEINKFEYGLGSDVYQVRPTKYQAVFGDPDNGFPQQKYGQRHGYRFDAAWALFFKKRLLKQISIAAGIQDSNGPWDSTFYTHLELPVLGWMQLFATYMRVKGENLQDLFKFDNARDRDNVILSGMRLQFLPFMFLNVHYARTYQVFRSAGSEYHLGNRNVVDSNGDPSMLPNDRLFETENRLLVELEIGWEASDDLDKVDGGRS